MSEDQNDEISSSIGENEEDEMEAAIQVFNKFENKMSMEKNEQTSTPGVVFQKLLCTFQKVDKNEDDHQNRIRQVIVLCGEMIEIVEKATHAHAGDFHNCLKLLYHRLSTFRFIARVQSEKLFIRETFFELLDLLSKSQICSYLNNGQHITILHQKFYKCLMCLLLTSAASTITYIPLMKNDIITRKYTDILCAIGNRLKYNLQPSTRTKQPIADDYQTIDCILSFLSNLTDRTVIVKWLLDIGFVKTMLECLKIVDLSSDIADRMITTIYNISRHDDGADELRKIDGLLMLKDIQSNGAEKLDADKDLTISMAIALLSTSEQIRSDNKRMNKILNQLLQMTILAAEAEDHREAGFHVSEPLAVFTKLFVDDHSVEYVLSHAETEPQLSVSSKISLFVKLLMKFRGAFADTNQLEEFTCTALLNIFWSISFQDRYITKLQQNKDLLKTIKSLAMDNGQTVVDQYIPRSMESMEKAANGILYNLNEISDSKEVAIADKPLVSNSSSEKTMIMISYSHSNNPFCDKILAEFEKNRNLFKIWIDRDHCTSNEDLWEKIARGISLSNLVICLLSEDYFNSKSCRKEATFAVMRKKPIIPVYIGEPGDCDWLDIHIADPKFVRFEDSTTELDRSKVQELLQTIEATIKETQTQPVHQQTKQHTIPTQPRKEDETIKPIVLDLKKPPEEWTADDICRWFYSHKVPDTLVKLYDFQSIAEMQEYSAKLRTNPKKEFIKYEQRYAKHYAGDELEEYIFNRFMNAVLSLTNSYSETVETSMPSDQTLTSKSNA